jgi:hypothetical protein
MPSPPYPNLRWSPVSMRSGAAPGPRLAPPELPPLLLGWGWGWGYKGRVHWREPGRVVRGWECA